MSDRLPAPEFDATQYERPSARWVCGHTAHGRPCRIGPSRWGRCQATFECQPVQDGQRWRCTRPKSAGGPCGDGPLPDGTCCRPIARCQPLLSWRAKRGVVTRWTCALTIAVLLVAFYSRARWQTINSGPLSTAHASVAFRQAAQNAGLNANNNCAGCHSAARGGPVSWLRTAFAAEPGPFEIHKLLAPASSQPTRLDAACLRCHAGHDFHQPNAVAGYSCSACHVEHAGPGPLTAPDNVHCLACHGHAGVMQAAFERGRQLGLQRSPPAVFESFAHHPEFRPPPDVSTLKFNHQKHLTGNIPLVNGRKLDCADCHQPDASGIYMQPVTYAAHCRACHSLQFDEHNPELQVPHGNPVAVRSYLRSLPLHYAELARQKGVPVEPFVADQMQRLRHLARAGEDLERQVFLSTAVRGEEGRPRYSGCAYCHEVRAVGDVTPPVAPVRWFDQARFDHAKHRSVNCRHCHAVQHSRETHDVLLPAKAVCVQCHSPAGGVRDSCATCHTYHNEPLKGLDFAGTSNTASAHPGK